MKGTVKMDPKTKVVMIGERRFRLPFLDLIPFDAKQNAELGEAIKEAGAVYVPIICWKEKKTSSEDTVVDGAHRVLWASEHCLKKIPIRYENYESEEEAKAACEGINFDRRHLSPTELDPLRRRRIERIAELRRQGESLRAIAEQEKISLAQAQRDLEKAGTCTGDGTPGPESGAVTGKDKKKYTAKQALCPRCKRMGQQVKDCAACERLLRKKDKMTKRKKKRETEQQESGLRDAFGTAVPKKCQAALGDPWIQSAIDTLAEVSEKVRMAKLMDGMRKREKHYPFIRTDDFVDCVGFIIQYLDEGIEHLKSKRPAAVCPQCNGQGCATCLSSGLVPREKYEWLKSEK